MVRIFMLIEFTTSKVVNPYFDTTNVDDGNELTHGSSVCHAEAGVRLTLKL
jgi:hypothetical protein